MADLIERKAALAALDRIQYWSPEDRYRAKKAIEALAPADVERNSAHWELDAEYEWETVYYCSRCGRRISLSKIVPEKLGRYPYCHCGARMNTTE